MPDHFHHRFSSVSAALRALADRFDSGGDATLATLGLDVTLHVLPADHPDSDATDTVRTATVDELCTRLGTVATYTRLGDYGTYAKTLVPGVKVAVFAQTDPPTRVLDTAQAAAWEMTCETSGCTNLPDPGLWHCTACGVAPILALINGGAS